MQHLPPDEVTLTALGPEVRDAAKRLLSLSPAGEARAWIGRLRRIQKMEGGVRKLRRVARASNLEALRDLLAELRYALVFDALGFTITCEPARTGRGPDFAVTRADASFTVEVHRFRPVSPQAPYGLASDGTLSPYGDGETAVRRGLYVIVDKLAQLGASEGVVALWSDDDGIEEIEAELAVRELLEEAQRGVRTIPPNLSHVLFGSGDVSVTGQQFYCYPLRGVMPRWASEVAATRFGV